jgi:hypothetical protein
MADWLLAARARHGLLVVALVGVCLAWAQLAFGLQTPAPTPAQWAGFTLVGYAFTHRTEAAPSAGKDFSHGELVHVQAAPREPGRSGFSMRLVALRKRAQVEFSLDAVHQRLPAVAVARGDGPADARGGAGVGARGGAPALAPAGGGTPAAAPVLALGSLHGRPALQTCITAHGVAGVDKTALSEAIDSVRERGWQARVRQVLGLQPPGRWECALVTIDVDRGDDAEQRLLTIWGQVQTAWQAQPPWPV